MINRYTTKAELYAEMNHLRNLLGVGLHSPNLFSAIKNLYSEIEVKREKIGDGTEIKGMFLWGPAGEPRIILNTMRDNTQHKHDFLHELIHFLYHGQFAPFYLCHDAQQHCRSQRSYFEWQANAGAAELLIPYKLIIPEYCCMTKEYEAGRTRNPNPIQFLADKYGVSPGVMLYRISSLSYEIDQYEKGVAMEKIVILSNSKQVERGISVSDRATHLACLGDFSETVHETYMTMFA